MKMAAGLRPAQNMIPPAQGGQWAAGRWDSAARSTGSGAACRQAARGLEDCYAIYKKADRAAVYAGWRDMNDYMRENKIESVTPQIAAQTAQAKSPAETH